MVPAGAYWAVPGADMAVPGADAPVRLPAERSADHRVVGLGADPEEVSPEALGAWPVEQLAGSGSFGMAAAPAVAAPVEAAEVEEHSGTEAAVEAADTLAEAVAGVEELPAVQAVVGVPVEGLAVHTAEALGAEVDHRILG